MIVDFTTFYRNNGLRRATQLVQPRFRSAADFQLPRRAIVHYAHLDPLKYGPAEDDVAFRGFVTKIKPDGTTALTPMSRPVWVDHVLQMAQPVLGQTVRTSANAAVLVRQFHTTYKRFRRVSLLKNALLDEQSLLTFNYGMLPHLVRYQRSPYNAYFDWMNTEATMWEKIAEVANMTDRPQFIIRHMPQVLPARSSLQQYATMKTANRRILNTFHSGEHLFLAELWKWIGPDRASSLLSKVPREKLRNVNIVFIEAGHWMVVNLGLLNSWRNPPKEELVNIDQAKKESKENLILPVNFQNMLLRMFMAITHLRTNADPEITEASDQVLEVEDAEELRRSLTAKSSTTEAEDRVLETVQRTLNRATPSAVPIFDDVANEAEDTPETVMVDQAALNKVEADLEAMERIKTSTLVDVSEDDEEDEITVVTPPPVVVPEFKRPAMHEAVMNVVNRLAEGGLISAAQYRNYEAVSSAYKTIIAPDGKSTLEEFINIPPEQLKITESAEMADIPTVPDKSMLKSSLADFDERYITDVFQRDVASMALDIQYAGVAVADYRSEHVPSIMGDYVMYSARLIPAEGSGTTVHWKLPYVDPDGVYMANGTKYKLRKQRVDLPIRKTAPDTVALTSYYGKSFVRRSEKKTHNYASWICNQIMAKMLTEADPVISDGHPGNLSDNHFVGPRLYSILASSFNGFTLTPAELPPELANMQFRLSFDHTKREELYGKDNIAKYEKNGAVIAGVGGANSDHYFLIGKSGMIGVGHNGRIIALTRFEKLLGISRAKAPVDIAVIKIAGATIPLGVMLAYEIGIDALIATLGAKVRKVPVGTRVMPTEDEDTIVFNDMTLVIERNDVVSAMFLAGFNEYHSPLRQYNYNLFNHRDVYLNLLEDMGMSTRHLREIDLFYQLFIDPVTRDLLIEMNEPTDMRLLLLRAGQMLVDDNHPDEFDAAYQRHRGYERMAGAVYTEFVNMMRKHNGRSGKGRQQLNLDPYAIFTAIQTDPSKLQVLEINPVQQLKEQEAVTYNGTGGRNSRTMTKSTRAYHENDKGTISGDTVDSGDVGINIYSSANPQYTSLRGMSRRYDKNMGATPLFSTPVLLSVAADHDDQKRVGFIGNQLTHAIASAGNHQMFVRTGYEGVIAQRTGDLYAAAAKFDGKVLSSNEHGIVVEYANGKKQGFELGKRYGNAAGLTIPHDVVANMKAGQVFKRGEIISYNRNFFEHDLLDPKNVVWKQGVLAKVVLMETTETLEDSSAISTKLAEKLNTNITKVIPIVVPFDQSVSKLVKRGDTVNPEDILCIIEDAVTARAGLFTEESLDTLRILSNQSPQAKVKGVVERVEVFYHGEIEDMSESLAAIAQESDRQLEYRLKSINKPIMTGAVDDAFRVDGESLPYNYLAIRVYVTSKVEMGEGDKGVFANQMKSVFGKKMTNEIITEDGEVIDAIFGNKSIEDRIVLSPYLIGTTNVLLDLIAQAAVKAYRS